MRHYVIMATDECGEDFLVDEIMADNEDEAREILNTRLDDLYDKYPEVQNFFVEPEYSKCRAGIFKNELPRLCNSNRGY